MKTIAFDLDNTLCRTNGNDYINSYPISHRIKKVNEMYDDGDYIKIYTARGMGSFRKNLKLVEYNYKELTEKQLRQWGVKYHELVFGKESYDLLVDDKAVNSDFFFPPRIGLIAGAFDVIHPGYVRAFNECKNYCEYLIVALHNDPSVENGKLKPILDIEERKDILNAIKFVDEIVLYSTEQELSETILSKMPAYRFLGDDYKNKEITGDFEFIEKIYLDRSHNWSTTKFKTLIQKQLNEK